MSNKKLFILGAGGFAREVSSYARLTHSIGGFIGTDPSTIGSLVGIYSIVATQDQLKSGLLAGNDFTIAIGTPRIIKSVADDLFHTASISWPNIGINEGSAIGDNVKFGQGNIVCRGNIFTTDIEVGNHNIFNLGNTIGHDVKIGNFCVINPGCHISGGVIVGDSCLIGTGSIVLEGIKIGEGSIIGGGAVVTKDVAPGSTMVGIPAKPLIR